MKIVFIIAFAILSSTYLFAQPTLTTKSIPLVGEKYSYSSYDTTGVKPGNSGANITWDFSKLVKLTGADETVSFEIVDPSNGPQSALFKESTHAYKEIIEGTNIPYVYYKSSNDKIERLGVGFEEGSEFLTDLELVSKFPFTYQNSYTDKFSGKLDVVADEEKMTLNRGGEISVVADAYGNVILPSGTFNNVLRLKITQSIGDTLPPPIPGFPGGLMETLTETYAWVSDDFKFALLSISYVTSKTTFPGVPTQTTNSMDVTIHDFKPSGGKTLTTPSLKSPANNSTKLNIPVTLEWNASILSKTDKKADELQQSINYILYVSDNEEFTNTETTLMFEVNGTSSQVTKLVDGTKYFWKVKGEYEDAESEWSEVYNFTTKLPKPATPTLVSPANNSTGNSSMKLELKWNSNNAFATRVLVTGPTMVEELIENESTLELYQLKANSNYTWKVKFYNAEGDSSNWSEEWSFATGPETSVEDDLINNNFELKLNSYDNNIVVNFLSNSYQNGSAKLYDINGNLIISNNYDFKIGENNLKIHLPKVSSGVYFVQIIIGNKSYQKSIIVE